MSHATDRPPLIDFHSHYFEPAWLPPEQFAAFTRGRPLLTDLDGQLAAMDAAGIDMKVLSAPLSSLAAPGAAPPPGSASRINDRFAALVAAHPDRLLALASIDAFGGEEAAREVVRAVTALGLGGICVDCARGERFLGAPETRPVLETAADLGVPVFVHPVSPAGYTDHLAPLGHVGVLLARGTEAAAGLYGLLRSGVLDDLPELTVVIPLIAAPLLLLAGLIDDEAGREGQVPVAPSKTLGRFYVDTMGFHPGTLRFLVETLGAAHVLVGSDWPIMPIAARSRVEGALAALPVSDAERAAILGGTARRLLTRRR